MRIEHALEVAPTRRGRRLRRLALALALLAGTTLLAGVVASPAVAAFGITAFDGQVSANADGDPYTQANGHPYDARVDIALASHRDANGLTIPDANVKDIQVDLPPGLVGNPEAAAKCTEPQLATFTCPLASQVGVTKVYLAEYGSTTRGVFNMVPPPGRPGAFAFRIGTEATVHLFPRLRSDGDYGLSMDVPNIAHNLLPHRTSVTFWGTPADPSHDAQRGGNYFCNEDDPFGAADFCTGGGNAAAVNPQAFLTNPPNCAAGPLTTTMRARSWFDPEWKTASFVSHLPPAFPAPPEDWGAPQGVTDCEDVPFDPGFRAKPTTTSTDAPTGLDVRLSFPQDGLTNPNGIATSPLKRAVVTLPEGMTINPSGADGLAACPDAQLGIGSLAEATCPDASKIGDVTATTPLLSEPLTGGAYLEPQRSGDPESGDMFRIALVLENKARGLSIKLPGKVRANAQTGRLETTFDDNPQLPVTSLDLQFKSGSRAPLATPPTCGTTTIDAQMTSWSGQTVTRSDTVTFDCPGVQGFAPAFQAGTLNPLAGASSPFVLRIDRADGQQYVDGLDMQLPAGLLAHLRDVPLCGDAQAAAGTCGEASRVGTATIGSGPGANPFFLTGNVYLTGPYNGGPFGLAVVVRALAGPFDLGTVVVRQSLRVDRDDAHVTVVSDPLPVVLKGVPLRLRSINVDVDRPGFMLNPTSCSQKRVSANLHSTAGSIAALGSRFAVTNCRSLRFAPKLAIQAGARGRTRTDITTPLKVNLTMPAGDANNRSIAVTLPKTLNARLTVVNRACTLSEFRAGSRKCTVVGNAVAVTPLLKDPLRGNAYFVRNPARRLPDLMVALKGQVDIDLTGKVTIPRDLTLRTDFDTIPDAPVTKFTLTLKAGRSGAVGVVTNLCTPRGRAGLARLAFRAQSGALVQRQQKLKIAGCAKSRRHAARRSSARRHAASRGKGKKKR